MANADKCHLNIPFKTYLMTLADAVDDEGNIDPKALKLAAAREFENYKAIERRVNNAGCGGGVCTCSYVHAISDPYTVTLTGGLSAYTDVTTFTIYSEEGGWTTSGGVLVPPSTTALYHMDCQGTFLHDSGASGVQATIQYGDVEYTTYFSGYAAPSFDLVVSGSRFANFTGVTPFWAVLLEAPVASTRTMDAYIDVWMVSYCGCVATEVID